MAQQPCRRNPKLRRPNPTVPATSATTTTHHYIINNLNFIGAPATQASTGPSTVIPGKEGAHQPSNTRENGGLDLIMQVGRTVNDFISSLPSEDVNHVSSSYNKRDQGANEAVNDERSSHVESKQGRQAGPRMEEPPGSGREIRSPSKTHPKRSSLIASKSPEQAHSPDHRYPHVMLRKVNTERLHAKTSHGLAQS